MMLLRPLLLIGLGVLAVWLARRRKHAEGRKAQRAVGAGRLVLMLKSEEVANEAVAVTLIQQGQTAHFVVNYDTSLGAQGPILADAVLATCEQDLAQLQGFFGNVIPPSLQFVINIIRDAAVGASHSPGRYGTTITCNAEGTTSPELLRNLVVAEVDEVFMYWQAAGWDPAASNGEGLSRVLADELHPQDPDWSATASDWLNSSRPDWVTNNDPTAGTEYYDPDSFVSIGCTTLFINYLRYQLHFSLAQIVQAGAALCNRRTRGSLVPTMPLALSPPYSSGTSPPVPRCISLTTTRSR